MSANSTSGAGSAKATKPKRTIVKATDFVTTVVKVYNAGGKLQDVANELGMKIGSVNTRLVGMRKKFPNLPSFLHNRGNSGGGNRVNADAINAILANVKPLEKSEKSAK